MKARIGVCEGICVFASTGAVLEGVRMFLDADGRIVCFALYCSAMTGETQDIEG